MTIPKGAISTFAELQEIIAKKKGQLYLSPGWSPKGEFIEGVVIADILEATEIDGGFTVKRLGRIDLFNLRGGEPPRLNVSGAFLFTNYWHAWAHYLQSKGRKHDRT